jgi:predicted dehydrogenase
MSTPDADTYALKSAETAEIPAPRLDYRPPRPKDYAPRIALVGAGGIAGAHLDAYRAAGFDVAAICSRSLASATRRRDEFFPEAQATTDFEALLADPSIEVLDITPHPAERLPLVEAAVKAGKHVLSQKPFAADIAGAERLVALAEERGVTLAVNQNGRWSPHMSWMRQAVRQGLVGEVNGIAVTIHWDHGWTAGTPFEEVPQLILYDFAIHWFDFVASLVGPRLEWVQASETMAAGQDSKGPLLAQAMVGFEGGQATLVFGGSTRFGPRDATYVAGTAGSLASEGPDLGRQQVTLTTAEGRAVPRLEGTWFNDGFAGAMGELLCAVEEGRVPENAARGNLAGLRLTFGAMESARGDGARVRL